MMDRSNFQSMQFFQTGPHFKLELPWLIQDIDIFFYSLHLQLRFSSWKSELCDFKISNSNFYDKIPRGVHFRICNSDFTAKIRVVCISKLATEFLPQKSELCVFQNVQLEFYRKNPSCVYFKMCNSNFTAKIRVVSISKFATRIFTAKIRVVCISKFATRIFGCL